MIKFKKNVRVFTTSFSSASVDVQTICKSFSRSFTEVSSFLISTWNRIKE